MTTDDSDLAGASLPYGDDERDFENAREVFPMVLDKDFTGQTDPKDFRPVASMENEGPKASSALASATLLTSTIGLEDVSKEDLDDPVNQTVKKDMSEVTTSENGLQTS